LGSKYRKVVTVLRSLILDGVMVLNFLGTLQAQCVHDSSKFSGPS
jgi:hypothetical protein